jgi:hypothetical protein
MQTIADRLLCAHQLIAQSIKSADRPANSVKLLAVSKTKPVSDLQQAYDAGQRLFGENYVQEGIEKVKALNHLNEIEWHFIGPLQSNKTKLVAEHFDWVQSVDRFKIAQRLANQRPSHLSPLNICIQINVDDESSKSGIIIDQVSAFASQIMALPNLRLRGLMAIPKASNDKRQLTKSFQAMRSVYHDLKAQYSSIDTLSMGMSSDLTLAIESNTTMVRIGTAIFGARN